MHAKNLPKMHFQNGKFINAPNKLVESDFVKNGLKKAIDFINKIKW